MPRIRGPAIVVIALIVVACAGPASTLQPTPLLTSQASPGSTPQPTSPPAPTTPPTSTPAGSETPSQTATAPTPTATPALPVWVERADVATGPSAREDHTWTVNGEGTIAYLFGGRGQGGASNELWAFDLATDSWAQVVQTVDTPLPQPRFGHTATWVPEVGLVIWSGQAGSTFFDDIWSWNQDANQWIQLDSLGAVPPARYGSCASLGPDGELWISHGFTEDSGRFSDTRSYNFESGTWTDRTPTGVVPVERCLHDCYWAPGDQLILYGGQTTGVAALGDIWAYDLATGAWARGPESDAAARQLYALTPLGARSLVFGGGSIDRGFLDDAWLIDADLGLAPVRLEVLLPAGRASATLITDDGRGRVLLFGGINDAGELADLWELPFGGI